MKQKHIYYADFGSLLSDYSEPKTNEEKLIKNKLNAIVDIVENCAEGESLFADEITLQFSHIISIIKNQHQKELLELTKKLDAVTVQGENAQSSYIPYINNSVSSQYQYDEEVLESFYNHFVKEGQLLYHEIDTINYESEEQRKKLVNLTMLDYCNRLKTFVNKYLCEIYPLDSIPKIIHGEEAEEYETFEPIVFMFNNLEMILAKFKIVEGKGQKQRLNIRSALRKLNEFKQAIETGCQPNMSNFVAMQNPLNKANIFESNEKIQEAFSYYIHNYYEEKHFIEAEINNMLDYLKKIWRRFYDEYKKGYLPKELSVDINNRDIVSDELTNVYNYSDILEIYIRMKEAEYKQTAKSWAKVREILDIFVKFVDFAKNYN